MSDPSSPFESWLRRAARAPAVAVKGDVLVPGAVVGGAFEVVRVLGSGGMGVVYLARDRRLRREVALKLHQRVGGAQGLRRLEGEARAMAGLSHPNVAAVYGTVRDGDRLFVVMEYVQSGDARGWLARRRRSVDAVLEVFIGAGKGLDAAHRMGIVHGDFKPDNVLVGEDGRARLTDFGLGLPHGSESTLPTGGEASPLEGASGMVGTQGYMAPELQEGRIGVASDQFAFCVAVAEALFGVRPPAGTPVAELMLRVEGRRSESARLKAVARVVERGVSEDPEKRWPSMGDVVDRLEALGVAAPPRRARWSVVAGLAGVAGLGLALVALYSRAPCPDGEVDLSTRYAQTLSPQLAAAFAGHRAEQLLWSDADDQLRGYAERWDQAQATACDADLAPADAEVMRTCLSTRRHGFEATTDLLAEAEDEVLARAPELVRQLDDLSPCRDPGAAASEPRLPDDEETAAEVQEVRRSLRTARYQLGLARFSDAHATVLLADQRARALSYPPLRPEVLLMMGRIGLHLDPKPALRQLEMAYFEARTERLDAVGLQAALEIVTAVDTDVAERETWLEHAEAVAAGAGEGSRARILLARSRVDLIANDYARAAAHLREALPLVGRDRNSRVKILRGLATALVRLDRSNEALEYLEQALAIVEADPGPFTVHTAQLLDSRGFALSQMGDFTAALADQERALEVCDTLLGPEDPISLTVAESLAHVLMELERPQEAVGHLRRVLAGREAVHGSEHRLVAFAHLSLGNALVLLERYAEAEEHIGHAVRLFESGQGGAVDVAYALLNLSAPVVRRDPRLAVQHLRRSVELLDPVLGPDHLDTILARQNLGAALVEADQPAEAKRLLDEVTTALRSRAGPPPPILIDALHAGARARLVLGDPAAALRLVSEGLEVLGRVEGKTSKEQPLRELGDQARKAMADG